MNNKFKRLCSFAVAAVFTMTMFTATVSYADDNISLEDRFPDPVFRDAIALAYDSNNDGYLSPDERDITIMPPVSSLVEELADSRGVDSEDLTISTLEGVECFENLTTLRCNSVGELGTLDVSAMSNLETLNCSDDGLTTLILNHGLRILHCCTNEFTSLDVSMCTELEFLHCYANHKLTSLNVTGLTNLETLRCDDCNLSSIDISTNSALYTFYCTNNHLSQLDLSNTSAHQLTGYHLGNQSISLNLIYEDGKIKAPIDLSADRVYSTSLDDDVKAYADGAFFTTDYSKIRDGFTYKYSTGKSGCAEMEVSVSVSHTHDYAVTSSDVDGKTITINCQICSEDEHTLDAELNTVTVDPDCTNNGTTTHTLTAVYDNVTYTDVKTVNIDPLGHNYQAVVTAPTCTEQGYTTYTCTRCTNSYKDNYTDATGHTNGEPVQENIVDATCTTGGTYDEVIYCTVCTQEVSRTPKNTEALGHNFGDWTETTAAVAPTCTAEGKTKIETKYCSRCDATQTRGGEKVDALGHNYQSVVTAPTCTEQGYTTYTCSRCTNSYTADFVDATGHTNGTPVNENVVNATCTSGGTYDEVVYCTVCTQEVSRTPKTTEALGHNFGDWTETTAAVAPTCTAEGKTKIETKYCSRCDATQTRGGEKVDALGHNYQSVVTAPTCTEQGYTTYTCSRCTNSYKDNYTDATGHTNGEPVQENIVDATCTTGGTYDEVIYCTVCKQEVSRTPKTTEALGHNFGDWVETTAAVAPTCTAEGKTKIETKYCSRCDATQTRGGEKVNALGHNYQTIVTAPTCTEQGYTTYTCSRGDHSYTADFVDATGHTNGEPVQENIVDATCTTGGTYDEVVYCTVCKQEVSRTPKTTDVLGHDYKAVVTAPTCTEQGYTTYTCSRGDHSYVDNYTDATGHTNAAPVTENAVGATCTAGGTYDEVVYCSVCHTEQSREHRTTAALGHNYKSVKTAPTCTAQGYTTHTCTRCNHSYIDSKTTALGHNWDKGVVTVEPTTQNEGKRKYTCTRCSKTKFEAIPKLKIADVTPTEKEAEKAKVNKKIKKPTKIHTVSHNNKKQLFIYFSPVKNAQNYRVMYRKKGAKTWKKSWTKGKTEYTIKKLKTYGLYEFKFAAYKKNANGKWERGDYSTTSYRYYYKSVITKITAAKNTITVKWKRNKNADYYTVMYSTNSNMKNCKKINIKPNSKTSYKIKGLKRGKKYYIRMRAVKKSSGRDYIGEFSKTYSVKTK